MKHSSNLSEQGEVVPLSQHTNLLLGQKVMTVKQSHISVHLNIEEAKELYLALKECFDE